MYYQPSHPGDRAGIAAFQNDEHFFFFGLEKNAGEKTQLVVSRRAGAGDPAQGKIIASTPFAVERGKAVELRIDARGSRYDFRYRTGEGWTPLLLDADGTVLSTRTAGGFVGTVIGLYAYRQD